MMGIPLQPCFCVIEQSFTMILKQMEVMKFAKLFTLGKPGRIAKGLELACSLVILAFSSFGNPYL